MNTKDKYLKYKFKYLNLKKQIALKPQHGGEPPKSILIVSHNSRIRCFLTHLYTIVTKVPKKVPRLKNTAIIKLEIRPGTDADIKVSLFYEGEVNNVKPGGYFVQKENGADEVLLPNFPKTALSISPEYMNNSYDIYIVRHGEGTHNVGKEEIDQDEIEPTISKDDETACNAETNTCKPGDVACSKPVDIKEVVDKVDTNLTPTGIQQAERAGKTLQDIVFYAVFVSDLFRTVQTFNGLKLKQSGLIPFVLPCSHEIRYNAKHCNDAWPANSRCRIIEAIRAKAAPENVSICRIKEKRNHPRCMDPQHNIRRWGYYDTIPDSTCKTSNMIEQSIILTEKILAKGIDGI